MKIKYKLIKCPYCLKEQDFINGVEMVDLEYEEHFWKINCLFCEKTFIVNYKIFGEISIHFKVEKE